MGRRELRQTVNRTHPRDKLICVIIVERVGNLICCRRIDFDRQCGRGPDVFDSGSDFTRTERFGEVGAGPGVSGFDDCVGRWVDRCQNDGNLLLFGADADDFRESDPRAGNVDIGDDHIWRAVTDLVERGRPVKSDLGWLVFEHRGDEPSQAIAIYDQDLWVSCRHRYPSNRVNGWIY